MKKQVLIAFAVGLCLTVNIWAQVPSYVPINGLVGYWPFNGNANDESGSGNNGTLNGATLTTDRFGVANKAYNFDGVDDFIQVNDANILDISNNFTISGWWNSNSSDYNQTILGKPRLIANSGYALAYNANSGSAVNMGLQSSSTNTGCGAPNIYSINSWHLVTGTYDGVTAKLFVDGVNVSIWTVTISLDNSALPLYFGREFSVSPFRYFSGQIDDIGIWNRALSDCEIADLYNAQLGSFSNATVSINPTSSAIGSNATLSVSTPIQSIQWQSNPSNIGWVNLSDNVNYNGVNNDTLVVSNMQLSNHDQPFRVLACGDTSNIANIQIADTCITNVTVYDTLLTTVTDTLIINTTLSLPAPNNENTILIYPNPASDHITIDNGNFAAMAGYSIKIENNAGQQVFQSAINQAQFYVDLSTWTGNGLYFVHLIDAQGNTVTVRKIVLQ